MLDSRLGSIRPWELDEFTHQELMMVEAWRDLLNKQAAQGGGQ